MKLKKHHIVLATLVVALSAAVYLNWQLSDNTSITVADTSKELGIATYVNSTISTKDEADDSISSENNGNLSDEQAEYFANSLSERQKAQDEVIELARQVLELSDSSDEAREDAVEQLSKIEDILLSQNRIEATLKAKGFSECMCYLSELFCTIIVPQNEMTESSALIIKDCVSENTDLPFENISIVEV